MNNIDISIIIVNWNTKEYILKCLRSITKSIKNFIYEIIIIDNASTDGSAEEIKYNFPNVKLIKNRVNRGLIKANNQGIESSKGNYILLLNSDTELKDNAIKVAYDYLKLNSKVGVVSGCLIFPDGKHQSVCQRFPSIRYQLFELLRLHKFLSKEKAGRILLGSFFNHEGTAPIIKGS